MTVSTTHIENTFTGDGVQTVFDFTFHILASTDLEAFVDDVAQSSSVYTVAINADQEADPGGSVTFMTPPPDDDEVLIRRVTPTIQSVGFSQESKLNSVALEAVLDKLTLLLQEAKFGTQGPTGATGPTGPAGPTAGIGGSGVRQAPTSGTLTGTYDHEGDWTSTGPITAERLRLRVRGSVTLNHAMTVSTELLGGANGAVGSLSNGGRGSGIGGGDGGVTVNGVQTHAGAGGGNGGNGGGGGTLGGTQQTPGGRAYQYEHQLAGSGGGGGSGVSTAAGAGGNGGGAVYIEATEDITINANISANGANGTAGTSNSDSGGGGGSGGTFAAICGGTYTQSVASTISLNGGNGGNGGGTNSDGGGGGGGGRNFVRALGTATVSGTVNRAGGSGGTGTGGGKNGEAGSTGVSDVVGGTGYGVRVGP